MTAERKKWFLAHFEPLTLYSDSHVLLVRHLLLVLVLLLLLLLLRHLVPSLSKWMPINNIVKLRLQQFFS